MTAEVDLIERMHRAICRAICREKCAFLGEPPCFLMEDANGVAEPWPNPDCDEPGCLALAVAAAAAVAP